MMKTGLVLGKFLPLHKGHLALIDFARRRCDHLIVLICAAESESIPGKLRLQWMQETYRGDEKIKPALFEYDENILPNTSVSSTDVSAQWAAAIKSRFPKFDLIFSSELYGAYLAECLGAEHISFDRERQKVAVSGTDVRNYPFKYWDMIAENARPFFVKKIALVGTESTGKSVLAERLAKHFDTVFVPEMAREIIEKTGECTPRHLLEITDRHARAIAEGAKNANKLLFVDTDINITRSYSRFLFGEELDVADSIDEVNRCDLYLYLGKDAPFVQDGTRLGPEQRDLLDDEHKRVFAERGIGYITIDGDWDERFDSAVKIVNGAFDTKS